MKHAEPPPVTTTHTSNASGSTVRTYDYDAFGNERSPSETDANPFRYCGEYWDSETGTYYLRARYYDPAIGRFTQADTHWNTANMIYGDNPQKINLREDKLGLKSYSYAPQITAIMQAGNLYVYCKNDPIAYLDPWGDAATRGQIHNWVVNDIVRRYKHIKMTSNKRIDYPSGAYGYADLISPKTGEVWEVKRLTISMSTAQDQLNKYINGRIHSKEILHEFGEVSLKLGGSAGTKIASNVIIQVYDGSVYVVYYFDLEDGMIYYNYSNWKYNRISLAPSKEKSNVPKSVIPAETNKAAAACMAVGIAAGIGLHLMGSTMQYSR